MKTSDVDRIEQYIAVKRDENRTYRNRIKLMRRSHSICVLLNQIADNATLIAQAEEFLMNWRVKNHLMKQKHTKL
jgi:hypothetical protein